MEAALGLFGAVLSVTLLGLGYWRMMASDSAEGWPNLEYSPKQQEHLLALGVAISRFNKLEAELASMLLHHISGPAAVAGAIIKSLSEEKRINLMEVSIRSSVYPDTIKNWHRHFLNGYQRCTTNRNILAHSSPIAVGDIGHTDLSDMILLIKREKRDNLKTNTFAPSLARLREVADAIKSFTLFGRCTTMHTLKHYSGIPPNLLPPLLSEVPWTLPDKPPLPETLTPHEGETSLGIPLPPQSFEA